METVVYIPGVTFTNKLPALDEYTVEKTGKM